MGLAAPDARRRLRFEAVNSTNTRALEAAAAGDPGPLWVTAERQTGGRGRRGRSWASPPGNLYASLLLLDPAPLDQLANLPLVAAVGVRDGLSQLRGLKDEPSIKWPNDILLSGAKCVGILIESERLADGRIAVVIGCGVNVEAPPVDAPYAVTSLRRAGVSAPIDRVFEGLAAGVEAAIERWRKGAGFESIRHEWLRHASGLGERCTVNLSDRSERGVFEALDDAGRLVLRKEDGTRQSYSAGDLFLLRAEEPAVAR